MSIPLTQVHTILAELQIPQITNLFAQAHAKHVLHEVNEAPENFPAFDPNLDEKVTFPSYALLAAACSMIEQEERADGAINLERAASLLQHVHGPHVGQSHESSFHVLVAAMAFYAAGHYSRAFVAIRSVEEQTLAAQVIGAFLRKDLWRVIEQLNEILLRNVSSFDDREDIYEWAIQTGIARAVALALEFTFTGNQDLLAIADSQLQDSAFIAAGANHSAWWWVVRLLQLMLRDLGAASPWSVLPPFFGANSANDLGRYVRLLAFAKRPISELWSSQRAALPVVLDRNNGGAVVNLRTSAGKTRIAELAILQVLLAEPRSRVLYLAPFRSLALEIEHTLGETFRWLGYQVSHLYGGSRVSSVDTELASESAITIATPEKARVLFRAAPELFENLKLVIIDEGHLIGPEERFVRNEVFIDHLRSLVRATGARLLLLSAVLPNAQELAEWVTGDSNAVASSNWKPSAERFGLLRWNGSRVRIDWQGEMPSFNPSFVEARRLDFGRRRTPYPRNKNEAIAATAVRLSTIGPVMIFTGRAVSIPTLAAGVLIGLGERPDNFPWPEHEWNVFETVCQEELDVNAIEVRAARVGVVCHSNRLTPQVRLALEHLMQSMPPKIIIATTTLAQGVNVGISSVIVATPYIGQQKTIDKRDFWNICGRAGRAFVDGEGKILYAIDDTREPWQIRRDLELARSYFDASLTDRVESGLLMAVRGLRLIAAQAGVTFDVLLELAANNDFLPLGSAAPDFEMICDLLDDELLALQIDPVVNPSAEEPTIWVERVFRDSLAAIQARSGVPDISAEDVLAFLGARANSVLRRVPRSVQRALVSSGLPLTVALRAHENLELFSGWADTYNAAEGALSALVATVREFEEWARINATGITGQIPDQVRLDAIREGWLAGLGLQTLTEFDHDAKDITREFYGYHLPWIVHAASQQLRASDETERADALAKVAMTIEIGVPSDLAARIFLAGVRSRAAATELAALDFSFGNSISEINRKLRDLEFTNELYQHASPRTAQWLNLLVAEAALGRTEPLPEFPAFTVAGAENADFLHARRLDDEIFLSTIDGQTRLNVQPTPELPFDLIANNPQVAFNRSGQEWRLVIRDPRLEA